MYDIIIIGAGPAGLTSSIYARRAGKKVLVLEAKSYGGQIINTPNIENYPGINSISGFDYATNLYEQAKSLGVLVQFAKVVDIKNYNDYKEVITNKEIYQTKVVILATGVNNRKLGLENEDQLLGKGVSYCATCDGAFYKNKDVLIVGGGNTALEDALYLSDICHKVYLVHRRAEFRGEQIIIDKAKEKNNVEFIYNSVITKINGVDHLESVTVLNKNNEERTLMVEGLFIAIGQIPETAFINKLVSVDDYGYIIAQEDCHTNIDGIYVAGDNRTKELRQLVTATSDGARAAFEAIKYLNNLEK